jgi:hypothetical protein
VAIGTTRGGDRHGRRKEASRVGGKRGRRKKRKRRNNSLYIYIYELIFQVNNKVT